MKIDFVRIEGGSFRMGSDREAVERQIHAFAYAFQDFGREEVRAWFLKQVPAFLVTVPSYEMSRALVTRAQFGEFEQAVFGESSSLAEGDGQLPVEGISYMQARQFCSWLSCELKAQISLPTEAEWEFAASSRGRFLFPWGDAWDRGKANTAECGFGHSSRAGAFSAGDSMQGIHDLAGNLEEWTDSVYLPYPGGVFIEDHISQEQGPAYPVLRGGCYRHHGDLCLAARRHGFRANYAMTGLRLVRRTPSDPSAFLSPH